MKKRMWLGIALATLLSVGMFAVAAPAPAARAAPAGGAGCPSSNALGNFKPASNVFASFSNAGSTSTYTFASLVNENPAGGVPGLVRYCVYPGTQPTTVDATAKGANGDAWTASIGSNNFVFSRPGGNPSNIPLDGKTTPMGTATFSGTAPGTQEILLHINDPNVCATLYGDDPGTCFVKPSTGPDCTHGLTDVAYNTMPFGVVDCPKPSLGFEANSTSEFGDEVMLAGTSRTLSKLEVLFASFACSVSGHWNTGDCVTASGATFTHDITATIYAASSGGLPGAQLAQVTVNQTIPYRPSADPACTGTNAGMWFNAAAGVCQNSISKVLTFDFTGITLPTDDVIWTVAFNTTHYGAAPIGPGAACFSSAPGCPYDSLNVGAKTYPGAPYAGTDVDPNGAFVNYQNGGFYCDGGTGGTGTLRLDTAPTDCWQGLTPLGRIITIP